MFRKVLIANRGAIACRIIRTLRRMGVRSVAVYSDADRHSLHVEQADEAIAIGPPPAAQSYLNVTALLDAARTTGAEAIHPGYGFLSESAAFAEACAANGIVFIGPTPQQMREFGLKHTARCVAADNGLPMLPGTGLLSGVEEALAAASRIGYPVMLKSTAGGGGIGMRLCGSAAELPDAYAVVERLSSASFGTAGLYLEKFVANARHIEVQIFGDGAGTVMALGERDCSTQRRHQKVIEETPAPGLTAEVRARLLDSARRLGEAVRYRSAGTVEFIYDRDTGAFYFLEVNTRLQVEHGVTEEVTGVDLVEWMVLAAAGELPNLRSMRLAPAGCSIQVRIYAEDPGHDFQPSSGRLTCVEWPESCRVETWVESGTEVTPYYDPMLAKIIVEGEDRASARDRLCEALAECRIEGIETNLEYLRQICGSAAFAAGGVTTSFLRGFDYRRRAVDVVTPGTQTTIQDYPGRLGYWHVGVPPSGPMDPLAFRIANRLLGNPPDAAGLEITITGPALRFRCDTEIALAGADFGARLDGTPIPLWKAIEVKAGALLELDAVRGPGTRGYLAIAGGFDAPKYLGSASTFILGQFGGFTGRVVRAGDVLPIGSRDTLSRPACGSARVGEFTNEWEIGVLYGPHGAPDFFTPADIETFFSTVWKVHHNSDRTGVRLIGPKPKWARKDGGEAGLHPSNIHDNAYAIGAVDFTGDMPVILGPDGPSLGGFVCPATIIDAELWKMGQLKPGDLVRFRGLA
jgi:urea carboxylase